MNLGQIRTLWRRYVHDVPIVSWDDIEANAIINAAYANVQTWITAIDPEAHIFWDYITTQANVSWYPQPQSFAPVEVGFKAAASDTAYTTLAGPYAYSDLKGLTEDGTVRWAIRGQWIGIFPAPSVGVTDGLELVHNPIMQLAGDNDVPRVKLTIHDLIAIEAALLAVGETDENTGWLKERKAEKLAALPLWYNPRLAGGEKFRIDSN